MSLSFTDKDSYNKSAEAQGQVQTDIVGTSSL